MVESLKTFLQNGISPIVLISGVGLILLSLTNRLARTIDRSRSIVAELEKGVTKRKELKIEELKILVKRSRILRGSIASISFSILCSSLIIPVLVINALFQVEFTLLGIFLFLLSVMGIILSAVLLFIDVTLTLKALDHEVKEYIS
ncbi:MAG: DUF2721 domain-containing protein [Melioribacteraceae bacterium]|nr:DUF2721 domain-containing protein [Melioribacteraceae bacterium]